LIIYLLIFLRWSYRHSTC